MKGSLAERIAAHKAKSDEHDRKAAELDRLLKERAAKSPKQRRAERARARQNEYYTIGELFLRGADCAVSGVSRQLVYGLIRAGDDDGARVAMIAHAHSMAERRGLASGDLPGVLARHGRTIDGGYLPPGITSAGFIVSATGDSGTGAAA